MPGKQIALWVVIGMTVGMTGCCRWCERHCGSPAATCCQPAYQAPPVYAQPAAYAAPACCAPQPTYPAPVGYQQNYSPQWQRPVVGANGCCE